MGCDSFFFPIPLGVSRFLHIFGGSLSGKPLLAHQLSMAKSRVSINPLYTGGAGGYSFYVRSGEQVVRQRRNNSNYGESASRSYPQMIRRIMWGNLVNIFKSIKSWQPKAYDSKAVGVTDYNMFMKLNINRATVGTSKQANEQGMAVWENYQVSNGSLPAITYTLNTADHRYVTDINVTEAITPAMTVGELAANLIANNPRFKAGDNLAFIIVKNHQYIGVEFPYAYSEYYEITLDVESTKPLSDVAVIGAKLTEDTNDKLCVTYPADEGGIGPVIQGIAIIHTRKVNGSLQVSSQSVLMTSDTFTQQYSGETWYQHCIDSYGIDTEVPLDPNFNNGVITRVTANGATLANAATLSGSQVIRVYGSSLYGQGYRFVHNNVDYTPLDSTDEYDEFLLTAGGSYRIYVNNQVYLSFSVTGVAMPSNMSGSVIGYMMREDLTVDDQSEKSTSSGCLNYNEEVTNEFPGYRVYLSLSEEPDVATDFEFVNCTNVGADWDGERGLLVISTEVTDSTKPAYIKYQDFIFFVGNY